MNSLASELCGYTTLTEPDLLFANNKTDKHPLRGLIDNGPYSLRFGAPSRLRFALLAPQKDMRRLTALVEELKSHASPREAKNYYPVYPGLEKLFRIPISDLDDRLKLSFPDDLDRHASTGQNANWPAGFSTPSLSSKQCEVVLIAS